LAAVVAACSTKGEVILNPEYDAGVDYFSIDRIELTDTATVMYASVHHLPNYWVEISSARRLRDSRGTVYKMLKCDGFELDKNVFMPESGTMPLTLYFEPVDKGETVVDLISKEPEEGVYGIKLCKVKHSEPVQCVLKGEVSGKPRGGRLALIPDGKDLNSPRVRFIPVRDGKFEYTLYADHEELWRIIFENSAREGSIRQGIRFIAATGTYHFTLSGDGNECSKNTVDGGKYRHYQTFIDSLYQTVPAHYEECHQKIEQLRKEKRYYTPEAAAIQDEIEKLNAKQHDLWQRMRELEKQGKAVTQEGLELEKESRQIYQTAHIDKILEFAKANVNAEGYLSLLECIRIFLSFNFHDFHEPKADTAPIFAVFHDLYENRYPDHPYTAMMKDYIQAAGVAVGKPCPDFMVEDSTGNKTTLSELIKGKIALIHIWSIWNAENRQDGRDFAPLYEKYKDSGFTVVGISRAPKRRGAVGAIEQEKYPWKTFVEAGDKNAICQKLGMDNDNYAGGNFLIDAQGNFLDIGTSPEKVKKILEAL
jgi:peroxiredoxin